MTMSIWWVLIRTKPSRSLLWELLLMVVWSSANINKKYFPNKTFSLKYAAQKCAWMDIPKCWTWFNEIFYPEVRRRTCHQVVLLINNGPGHFEASQSQNIVVRYFTPNLTSWKQPCVLEVIATVKKRCKFLLLKHLPSFYQLDNDNQQLLKEEASNFCRGSVGVR